MSSALRLSRSRHVCRVGCGRAALLQVDEYLLEKLARDTRRIGDLGNLRLFAGRKVGQYGQRTDCVAGFLGQHAALVYSSQRKRVLNEFSTSSRR